MMKEQAGQQLVQSEHTFSNNTLKSASNNNFFGDSHTNNTCSFCQIKPYIFRQLDCLKDAIAAKNQKIKELEELIQKISKMAFTSSTDAEENHQFSTLKNHNKSKTYQELTFAQCDPSPTHESRINEFTQSIKA
jgi:uncharacterized protein (DUF342 family)